MTDLTNAPLGKSSTYPTAYDASLLYPIPRESNRAALAFKAGLFPFSGVDIWTAFELSWLNPKGKPQVAIATFRLPFDSPHLIESKSFKLYLNSLNQAHFDSIETVQHRLQQDLTQAAGKPVSVTLLSPNDFSALSTETWPGTCLDDIDVDMAYNDVRPNTLKTSGVDTAETLYSHLLKSNCPITQQPDWASVMIRYQGPEIDHAGLLQYILSYRQHAEFHEHCVERIFMDILNHCHPEKLTVYARYTRRGGLDINPFRSNFEAAPENIRLARQ